MLERPAANVLVFYFDPGCPHCAAMAPALEALAAEALAAGELHPNRAGGLQVVRLDATANDPGDGDWKAPKAVPALHLYPALAPGAGERGAGDFVAFSGGGGGGAEGLLAEVRSFVEAARGALPASPRGRSAGGKF